MKSINRSPAVKWLALLPLVFVCVETTIDGHRAQGSPAPTNKGSSDLRGRLRHAPAATRVTASIQSRLAWSRPLDFPHQCQGARITRQFKSFNARVMIRDGIMIGDAVTQAQAAMVNGDDASCLR